MTSGDAGLAKAAIEAWLPGAGLTPLDAMNSTTWLVEHEGRRAVLKIAAPNGAAGLRAAACLAERGIETGAPLRVARRAGRLIALLRFVEGKPLTAAQAERIGATLGRAHLGLRSARPSPTIDRWPWPWLDPGLIREPELRDAATAAIERANGLATGLTDGILHGDPAPEAFLDQGDATALIDWGSCAQGPLLFDLASAVMYAGPDVAIGYRATGALPDAELDHLDAFGAFRWALQAWYFSRRIATADLTGIDDAADNDEGLADARRALLG